MNVGGADPQAPRHPAALRSGTSDTGSYAHERPGQEPTAMAGTVEGSGPDEDRPSADPTTSTGRAPGPDAPAQQTSGTAHRAPGQQGSTPDGEAVETDVQGGAGAARPAGPRQPRRGEPRSGR